MFKFLKSDLNLKNFFSRNNLGFIVLSSIIFLIAVGTRFLFLDKIPTVLSHDEMGYVINSVSVAFTGKGKSGEWQPFSFSPVEPTLAELPALFIAPFMLLPFSNLVNARIIFALMSLTLPFFIAFICFELTKSKSASYLSWIIALFNPWIWQNGRMTFDPAFSLWFYVIGILIFLKAKSFWKLLSLVPFFAGFYCYQGYKLLLPLIGIVLFLFSFFKKEKFIFTKKQFLVSFLFLFGAISLFGFYFFNQFSTQAGSVEKMQGQILTINSDSSILAVNNSRRLAIDTPINKFFINKYSQYFKEIVGRYMLVFGWRELFFEISASNSSFSVWNHGIFYLLDILFLGCGFIFFIKKKQFKMLFFLLGMLMIGAVPAAINQGTWLFFRHSLIIPVLIILMGAGWSLILYKNKLLFILSSFIYLILIINFAFIYFFQYPIFASEDIFFSPRLLGEYVSRISSSKKVIIFDNEAEFVFTSYIFYNDIFNKNNAQLIQWAYKNKQYEWENMSVDNCISHNLVLDSDTTYIIKANAGMCDDNLKQAGVKLNPLDFFADFALPVYIKSIKDSGDDYIIYGDSICTDFKNLAKFINPQSLKNFDFDKLSNDDFCRIWITKSL